jgi:putative transcriptional regulator
MEIESKPLVAFDDVETPDPRQKIYNKFKFVSDVPDFTIAEIKEIRHKLGLSQSMLAQILGVARRTAEAWEAGYKVPNGSARRILQILKTDTDAIRRSGIAEW